MTNTITNGSGYINACRDVFTNYTTHSLIIGLSQKIFIPKVTVVDNNRMYLIIVYASPFCPSLSPLRERLHAGGTKACLH